jgi:hypothetical protein
MHFTLKSTLRPFSRRTVEMTEKEKKMVVLVFFILQIPIVFSWYKCGTLPKLLVVNFQTCIVYIAEQIVELILILFFLTHYLFLHISRFSSDRF